MIDSEVVTLPLACPTCRAPLVATRDGLECSADEETFPRLGPFLVLLPSADVALSRHRDAFLAALAESGDVPASALARIEAAHRYHRAAPEPLQEDVTGPEEGIADSPGPAGPASETLDELDRLAVERGPLAAIIERLPADLGRVAEVGPGAGLLSRELAERAEELVLVDRVPRALLRASRAIGHEELPSPELVVALGEALPLEAEAYDCVAAMNVVDLLDDPASFLEHALDALRPGGLLILSSPDPGLGGPSPQVLGELVVALGGVVREVVDGLPWLRHVSARHRQVYLAQVLVAERAD